MHYINSDYNTNDRYDMAKFMNLNVDNYDPLDSYMFRQIKNMPVLGVYVIRDLQEVGRPEQVSYKLYRDVKYWWILLLYNDILNIDELKLGKSLNFFSIDKLESIYFELRSKQ